MDSKPTVHLDDKDDHDRPQICSISLDKYDNAEYDPAIENPLLKFGRHMRPRHSEMDVDFFCVRMNLLQKTTLLHTAVADPRLTELLYEVPGLDTVSPGSNPVLPEEHLATLKMRENTERRSTGLRGVRIKQSELPTKPYDCDGCRTCRFQYFPAFRTLSDKEASESVNVLVGNAHKSLEYLRSAMAHHADTLVTRWRKKSKDKRFDFLRKNSDLYPRKWAPVHLNHIRHGYSGSSYPNELNMYHDTWLTPYLDQETLANEPLLLLSLLQHRTISRPEDWVMFDNSQLALQESQCYLVSEFNSQCVVLLGSDFGTLVPWEENKARHFDIVGYTRAIRILAAQERLMKFLQRVIRALLEECNIAVTILEKVEYVDQSSPNRTPDTAKSALPDTETIPTAAASSSPFISTESVPSIHKQPKWEQLVQNGFISFGTSSEVSSTSYAKQPFSAPPRFDPFQTIHEVKIRYFAAFDELANMQTDPDVQQLVRDMCATGSLEDTDKVNTWRLLVDELLANAIRLERAWRQLFRRCDYLVRCMMRLLENPTAESAAEYQNQINAVLEATELLVYQVNLLRFSLPYQRGFKQNYSWRHNSSVPWKHHVPNFNKCDYFEKDRAFWCLSALGFDRFRQSTQDISLQLRILDDHLSRASSKEKNRINQQQLRYISDIAAVDAIITAIHGHRVRDQEVDPRMVGVRRHHYMRSQDESIWQHVSIALFPFLCKLCTSTPFPKGRLDEEWRKKAEASRNKLEFIWEVVRSVTKEQYERLGVEEWWIEDELAVLSVCERENYKAEVEAERQAVSKAIQQGQKPGLPFDVEPMQSTWGKEFSAVEAATRTALAKAKARAKSRQHKPSSSEDAVNDLNQAESAQDTSLEEMLPPRVLLKVANMALLSQMFPDPAKHSHRSFAWQHFETAMIDAGFSVQRGGGSGVSFKNEQGSIVFHKPHPEPFINPIMLKSMGKRMQKSMGKRMQKRFAWSRDVFEVREK